ncbi:MAG TPA: hypothetical protein VFA50_15165 [Stellaceae bacterium]|nr:hypothetical protein [Stellaceae bacterium]
MFDFDVVTGPMPNQNRKPGGAQQQAQAPVAGKNGAGAAPPIAAATTAGASERPAPRRTASQR